jgi:hypothetical protein
MTATTQQAIDDMYGAVAAVLTGQFPDVVRKYDGLDDHTPPDNQSAWTYTMIRHATGTQASLAGADATRRWNATGTLFTQIFVPLNKQGRQQAVTIADALKTTIQKLQTEHGVWFRGAILKEIGVDGSWYQVNFTATFTYDTFA